jgi:transposase
LDLRERILAALKEDSSSLRVADRFRVSASFVRKLRCQARDGGDIRPRHGGGKPRLLKRKHEEKVLELVRKHPDATLLDLSRFLQKSTGIAPSETTMWRTLRRLGITLKKRSSTPPNATGRM